MLSRHALRRTALIAATLGAALVPTASPAIAADDTCTRYAARSGSDAYPGTADAPKLTVQALVNSLQSGQTGCLRGGTYTETSNGYVARMSTPGITLRSAPGERARIAGIVYIVSSASGARISDLDIEGTGSSNTVKIYAPDVVIERNAITNLHRGQSCMMLGSNSGAGQATRVIVRRNVFTACGSPANTNKDHAIYASNVDGGQIVDNVISDPSAYAIQLYPNARNTRFAHNVVDGGASIRGGVLFGGDTSFASTGNVVEANVITYAATYSLTASWGGVIGSGNVARANCVHGSAMGAVGSTAGWANEAMVSANPQFVDRAAGDYRLAPGSPCLSVVGYDTARLIAGEGTAPAPSPTPEPTPTAPAPEPTPAPTAEPTPEPTPDAPAATPEPTPQAPAPTPEPTVAPVNLPPAVELTSPVAGSSAKSPLQMAADATDDGAVAKVEFYVDGKLMATDRSAPFAVGMTLPKRMRTGWHTATARAYDAAGLSAASAGVSFRTGDAARTTRSSRTSARSARVAKAKRIKQRKARAAKRRRASRA